MAADLEQNCIFTLPHGASRPSEGRIASAKQQSRIPRFLCYKFPFSHIKCLIHDLIIRDCSKVKTIHLSQIFSHKNHRVWLFFQTFPFLHFWSKNRIFSEINHFYCFVLTITTYRTYQNPLELIWSCKIDFQGFWTKFKIFNNSNILW